MAEKEMFDYLTTLAADSTVELTVVPQRILTEYGEKYGEIHTGDDNSEERISFTTAAQFSVTMEYPYQNSTVAGTIIDMFYSATIGNGMFRTWVWQHPTDGHKYTARFDAPMQRQIQEASLHGVLGIKIRVLGKAATA